MAFAHSAQLCLLYSAYCIFITFTALASLTTLLQAYHKSCYRQLFFAKLAVVSLQFIIKYADIIQFCFTKKMYSSKLLKTMILVTNAFIS